jgi:nicotinamide riboside transporter PnuC
MEVLLIARNVMMVILLLVKFALNIRIALVYQVILMNNLKIVYHVLRDVKGVIKIHA